MSSEKDTIISWLYAPNQSFPVKDNAIFKLAQFIAKDETGESLLEALREALRPKPAAPVEDPKPDLAPNVQKLVDMLAETEDPDADAISLINIFKADPSGAHLESLADSLRAVKKAGRKKAAVKNPPPQLTPLTRKRARDAAADGATSLDLLCA